MESQSSFGRFSALQVSCSYRPAIRFLIVLAYSSHFEVTSDENGTLEDISRVLNGKEQHARVHG